MVTSGVAGGIVVRVGTVDKLTTVDAPGRLPPLPQGIRVGGGLAFVPDTLALGRGR
jgi:hypothetical protein